MNKESFFLIFTAIGVATLGIAYGSHPNLSFLPIPFLDNINKMKIDREKLNISPEILNIDQVNELCEILSKKKVYKHSDLFLDLFKNRISPGVDDTSKVKASFLNNICKDVMYSPYINKEEAFKILGTMQGGYNIEPLIDMLSDKKLGELAAKKLSNLILIFG